MAGRGLGKEIVRSRHSLAEERSARVIGLETMPRTMDNIGFYSGLGFLPTRLTVTLTLDAAGGDAPALLYGRLATRDKDDLLAECLTLTQSMVAGYDYTREIALTDALSLGRYAARSRSGQVWWRSRCVTRRRSSRANARGAARAQDGRERSVAIRDVLPGAHGLCSAQRDTAGRVSGAG